MSWSWRIGRIAGIDVYMHFTFLILVAWFALSHYGANRDPMEALRGVLFILALFGIVVLHELGHALAARRYGIRTRDITLLPIGGVARLERIPEDPKQELVVAIAGPLVNVVLAAVIYLVLSVDIRLAELTNATRVGGDFLAQMFLVNVMLVFFNMLPAFPMDGGRVLRALLAMRMDYVRATQIAAGIGQAMAIAFAAWGLFASVFGFTSNPFLLFIALFVWLGAAGEASMVQLRSALGGIPVMRVMITSFHTLRPDDRLARAVDHVLAGFQQDFPVVENDSLVGILTRSGMAAAIAQHGTEGRVGDAMQHEFVAVSPRDMLETAFTKLQDCNCHTLPVVHDGRLVGLMTSDNVAEVLMIQESLREASRRQTAPDTTSRHSSAIPLKLSQPGSGVFNPRSN
ncbi:MAG TPA: site-2 protease family protein [Lacipirellulaceae bacterium]|nr:site-2 protease family protein [Lacipirellulaceae bacterium]